VVAIEFALVAPFILLLMLAGTDLTIFMRTKMRIDEVATEVALMVTQYQNLYVSDFSPPATAPLFDAAQIIAGTTPVTGLLGTTIITGIVTDANDKQTIAWQYQSDQATFTSLFGTAKGSVPTLPNNYKMPINSTLIAVEAFTSASPWVLSASLMGGAGTTSLWSYALYQPRLGSLSTVNPGTRP
jgi:Flp pilus assembly protein TadG